jgi:hypothetical protein
MFITLFVNLFIALFMNLLTALFINLFIALFINLFIALILLQEPYNPGEEEDPYATVEFVPKSKRKPPRPKGEKAESEGVYATITDIRENP